MEEQRNQQFLCACTEERSGRDLERQGLLLRENLSLGTKMLADRVWRPFLLGALFFAKDTKKNLRPLPDARKLINRNERKSRPQSPTQLSD